LNKIYLNLPVIFLTTQKSNDAHNMQATYKIAGALKNIGNNMKIAAEAHLKTTCQTQIVKWAGYNKFNIKFIFFNN